MSEAMTVEDARKMLQSQRDERIRAAHAAIDAAKAEYRFEIVGIPRYTQDGRTVADVAIVLVDD